MKSPKEEKDDRNRLITISASKKNQMKEEQHSNTGLTQQGDNLKKDVYLT